MPWTSTGGDKPRPYGPVAQKRRGDPIAPEGRTAPALLDTPAGREETLAAIVVVMPVDTVVADTGTHDEYMRTHRRALLFVPLIVGIFFWLMVVALADEPARDVVDRNPPARSNSADGPRLAAYTGIYERFGFRNRSKVLSTPFFNPEAMERVAIAYAYSAPNKLDHTQELRELIMNGKVAVATRNKDGKYVVSDVRKHLQADPAGLQKLLSRDDSFLLTSVDSILDAHSDFRVVSWDAQTMIRPDSDHKDTEEQDPGKPAFDYDRVTSEE